MSALKKQVLVLEADLRARVDGDDVSIRQDGVNDAWRSEYDALLKAERTGISWMEWRNDRITQAAVSWVLLTVFARYCEDNHLVTPRWISGSTDDERGHALDARTAYFRTNPEHTDRDWLTTIADHFTTYPATAGLVDPYTPMWQVAPSGDAARTLLEFWWDRDDTGRPRWSFTGVDTRFLGDVYQDLSDHAKKTYALLQTPEFVEEFILDRTLEPALNDRPLDGFTMIDPTCGSGHFLLGAFHRLHTRWQHHAPALGQRELVQKALDAVHGVDINPFAVAIARFRLLIAALHAAGDTNLEQPIGYTTHLAAGDSLLWGAPQQLLPTGILAAERGRTVTTGEDSKALTEILQREHDTVVGNPPYINVEDPALNNRYRSLYSTPFRTYALTIPFMELFFRLARDGRDRRVPSGWVGQITSNSFMKRSFGVKLIENFLPTVDLREILDTSGAYIPGHSTPTAIIIGRNNSPQSNDIWTIAGVRGEDSRPKAPQDGHVWREIVRTVPGRTASGQYTSSGVISRRVLARHPWAFGLGKTASAVAILEQQNTRRLIDVIDKSIGRAVRIGADDAFLRHRNTQRGSFYSEPILRGEDVRDWHAEPSSRGYFPYIWGTTKLRDPVAPDELWPLRTSLADRRTFVGNMADAGRQWWEYMQHTASAYETELSITFSNLATANHFCLIESKYVFTSHSPIIKLKSAATQMDYIRLLGVLNSSVVCFWLKQKSHSRANATAASGIADQPWSFNWEFTGATLRGLPLPTKLTTGPSVRLNNLAKRFAAASPRPPSKTGIPLPTAFETAKAEADGLRGLMVAEQEELDWEYYRIYSLIEEDLTYAGDVPPIALGERAFEISLARRVADGTEGTQWFTRHRSTPITEIPAHLPEDYQALLQRRLGIIATNPHIELLERPEYKRRWATEPWDKQVLAAQRTWLLDRLEHRDLWFDRDGRPTPKSVAQLADLTDHDPAYRAVLAAWAGNPDITTTSALTTLLDDEHVPYLAAYRYQTPAGLDKRQSWEHTWDLQRREDAGDTLDAPIPVPPKYKPADFRKTSYWSHRGKLDVPKERFISYPDAGRDTDPTLLLGWAGWDHGEQALALATLTTERAEDGFTTEQLTPLIAGLHELAPWVRQWHSTIDPDYGQSLADTIDEELHTHLTTHHLTSTDLTTWQPAPATRGRRTKKATT
ncbi:BREX-2 system adenine-specific DNA-methyltransferase PglX [Rhodococcus sp. 1R11]|uniref:BREX-2 system adenine-specific DNA-methyltransferase PglX n=1 Tax=Rhodococcus sp. 1R11 TaxID=2559614 RepID=UPI001FD6EFB5|nr:BREX-2 system adenine-specific DNA-methyltransferase PglX [Rhodococcus sp. 1R11]